MSSHHIVREKQEPALLVLSLNNFADELLGQLLEWSPTVITTPLTAEQISSQGIKVDLIIANAADTVQQSDVRLIPVQGDPVAAALAFLIANNYSAVNIIADDQSVDDFTAYAGQINLVVFSGSQKIYPVISGFSKWKPAGENIRLLSPAGNLKTGGLTNVAGNHYITTGDGLFTLNFTAPFLFVSEDI